jgi:hypothetical protein
VVEVYGGRDGYTSLGTLEKAAAAFVKTYVATKGDVRKATAAANEIIINDADFVAKGKKINKGDAAEAKRVN